jgi:beta-phosphoglucomutase-like phosphatase (HAD superfamily)
VLEDSFHGARAGHSAGCRVIMVPDGIEPDEEIQKILYKRCDSLNDVIDCLKAE